MDKQYRLLWSTISRSKKIRGISGTKQFRIACHLAYTWMLPWGDDEGRLIGDPLWVLANVLPYEDLSIREIEDILTELNRVELVRWYEIEGEKYIEIVDWREHQRIRPDRVKKSSYPGYLSICGQTAADCREQDDLSAEKCRLSPSPSPSPSPSCRAADKNAAALVGRSSSEKIPLKDAVQEVLTVLNDTRAEITGKPSSRKVDDNIKARLKEGYTVNELCRIIVFKATQDHFRKDNAMYLRESTLFRKSNANTYLEEANEWTP